MCYSSVRLPAHQQLCDAPHLPEESKEGSSAAPLTHHTSNQVHPLPWRLAVGGWGCHLLPVWLAAVIASWRADPCSQGPRTRVQHHSTDSVAELCGASRNGLHMHETSDWRPQSSPSETTRAMKATRWQMLCSAMILIDWRLQEEGQRLGPIQRNPYVG